MLLFYQMAGKMFLRYTLWPFILLLGLLVNSASARTFSITRGSNLQAVINHALDNDTILIGAKDINATRTEFVDSLCGNCGNHQTLVNASCGFLVSGKSLHLIGEDRKKTRLITNSGYGLLFINSPNSSITNLSITGGKRDPDPNATDAAIVVRNSSLSIHDIDIVDNSDRIDSVTVGIGGIFGREGAELNIENCIISGNGWDGIALYRGAVATVSDCIIKDGRGVGIRVTWDATCMAYRNTITGYWKGIGSFGTSWVIARNNIVHDNLGWGIIATGSSFMDMANNLVYHNGNCGIAPWSTESRGRIINNVIIKNGWKDEWVCPCVGVWNFGDWAKWEFSHNIVWGNKEDNYRDIWDQSEISGNLSVDPLLINDSVFHFQSESPIIDAGHPNIRDIDGTRSDMGPYGGPQGFSR